jgi:hypothetical protein
MTGPLERGAADVLGRRGPLSTEELGLEMVTVGATRSQNPSQAALQAVARSRRFYQLDDGRWLDRIAALRRGRLPHRITDLERRIEALRVDPDFSVVGDLVQHGIVQAWPGWGAMRLVWLRDATLDARYRPAPDRFLSLPIGAFDHIPRGSMAYLSIDKEVPVLVMRAMQPVNEPSPETVRLFREVASQRLRDDSPSVRDRWSVPAFTRIDDLVFEALGRDSQALSRATTPIGEILREGALETYREFVGRPKTLWSRVDPQAAVWQLIDAEDVDALPWDDWDGRYPRLSMD